MLFLTESLSPKPGVQGRAMDQARTKGALTNIVNILLSTPFNDLDCDKIFDQRWSLIYANI